MNLITIYYRLFDYLFPRPFSLKEIEKIPNSMKKNMVHSFSLWNYKDSRVKSIVRYIKNNNDKELMSHIATCIIQKIPHFAAPLLVIPVPISYETYTKRGFNQVRYLSQCIAKEYSGICLSKYKIKKKKTQKQSLLSKKERKGNIRNAFFCDDESTFNKYNTIILVDDLITTGATLNELRNFVMSQGGNNVIMISIAH